MYALMPYKIALLPECLLAYITSIRALTTMYAFMCYKSALVTECLLTNFTAIRKLNTMYALMCYKTALLIEYLITYITSIRAITTIYITGKPAFSVVCALVKTQRLNITIYSDRKTFISIAMCH